MRSYDGGYGEREQHTEAPKYALLLLLYVALVPRNFLWLWGVTVRDADHQHLLLLLLLLLAFDLLQRNGQ